MACGGVTILPLHLPSFLNVRDSTTIVVLSLTSDSLTQAACIMADLIYSNKSTLYGHRMVIERILAHLVP
jgi:hypothetical protein